MNQTGNTILITGGGSGIGLALTRLLYEAGNRIIICGRRKSVLEEAKKAMPELHIYECDLADPAQRVRLTEQVTAAHPKLNVLINNAGKQEFLHLPAAAAEEKSWATYQEEIAINLEAPVHITMLLLSHLTRQTNPAILNVTSGLAFVPYAAVPLYSATKAAFHSFTLSLRHQLTGSGVEVIEIIPPAVDTDLGGAGKHTYGVPADQFARSVLERIMAGEKEVGYGGSEEMRMFGKTEITERFGLLNGR